MTLEVKQRIVLIQRGEVPEGYKKTKVGIIPAEWETVRFKDKFDRLMRRNGEGNSNVLTISAQHGLISQEDFFNKEVAGEDKSNYFLLRRGEYAYNKSYSSGYPFGAIKRLDRYDAGIVSPLYICFSDGKENKCPEYYLQYFEGGKLNSEIHAFAQEGARNHGLLNISIDDFFNSAIPNPPLHEQQRIVEIFSAQEKVIALLEQKTEQLRQIKKYCLSKMIPKRGENVPEIRFPGFNGAWEQRKLGEVTEKFKSGTFIAAADIDDTGEYPVYGGNGLRGYASSYNHEGEFALIGRQGALCGNMNYSIGKAFFTEHAVAVKANETSNTRFLYYLLDKMNLGQYSDQSAQPGLAVGKLVQLKNMFPTKAEQDRIGCFFEELDNLITLHQRMCNEEKQKKKALMQLLLTGIVRIRK